MAQIMKVIIAEKALEQLSAKAILTATRLNWIPMLTNSEEETPFEVMFLASSMAAPKTETANFESFERRAIIKQLKVPIVFRFDKLGKMLINMATPSQVISTILKSASKRE